MGWQTYPPTHVLYKQRRNSELLSKWNPFHTERDKKNITFWALVHQFHARKVHYPLASVHCFDGYDHNLTCIAFVF